ncbi:MAG: MBL fold metallo-hydrolase, partial [Nitrososphaerales archaeon]
FASQGSEYIPKDYRPPPGLIEQLTHFGISVEGITHVVITHAHYDHYSGVTMKKDDGTLVPTFPKARYFLGKPDWVDERTQKSLADPSSDDSKTLGALKKFGVLELVEGDLDLVPDVRIIAAPGESSGHQILKINSSGSTLYCIGDLFHDPVEVENPSWMATWADPQTNLKSRESLIEDSLGENAVIVAAHMPVGKLVRNGKGAKFLPLLEFL